MSKGYWVVSITVTDEAPYKEQALRLLLAGAAIQHMVIVEGLP